jgi:hypothetical protein
MQAQSFDANLWLEALTSIGGGYALMLRIPRSSRPSFRNDAAHHSDLIAPTVPR